MTKRPRTSQIIEDVAIATADPRVEPDSFRPPRRKSSMPKRPAVNAQVANAQISADGVANLRRQLATLQTRLAEMERAHASELQGRAEDAEKIDELSRRVAQAEKANNADAERASALEARIAEAEKTRAEHAESNATLRESVESERKRADEAAAQLATITKREASLTQELEELRQKLHEAGERSTAAVAELATRGAELARRRREREELEARLKSNETQSAESSERIAKLEEQAAESSSRLEVAAKTSDELRQSLEEAQKAASQREHTESELHRELALALEEARTQRQGAERASTLETELSNLAAEVSQEKAARASIESEVGRLQAELASERDRVQTEVTAERERTAQANEQVRALEQSAEIASVVTKELHAKVASLETDLAAARETHQQRGNLFAETEAAFKALLVADEEMDELRRKAKGALAKSALASLEGVTLPRTSGRPSGRPSNPSPSKPARGRKPPPPLPRPKASLAPGVLVDESQVEMLDAEESATEGGDEEAGAK